MPHSEPTPISAPALVVVTGANGFIAAHTISVLLSNGFKVLGTVRSASKAAVVQRTHSSSPNAHLLSTAIVENITDPAAYSAIFAEAKPQAILHLASPFAYSATDFEAELMQPAVKGTEAVFKAAAEQSSVRRIIHTNSFACIYNASLGPRQGYTYTSDDWCPLTYDDGKNAANSAIAYRASKAVAEKTGWNFMENTPGLNFDLVSLCPAMVFGPFINHEALPSSIDSLNTSNKLVWDVVSAGEDSVMPPTKGPVWVDVRDVAEAHVKALQTPEAGGQRFLLANGVYCSQEIADVARQVAPKQGSRIPQGIPGKRESDTHFAVDSTLDAKTLGIKWRGLDVCLTDLLPQLYAIEGAGGN